MPGSYDERATWIQLFAVVVTFAAGAAVVARMLARGETDIVAYAWVYGGAFVALVTIIVAGHILSAILAVTVGGEDPDAVDRTDERDRVIAWRAEACTSWLVGVGVFAAVVMLIVEASPIWVANVLVGCGYVSETVKYLLQLRWYRLGMPAIG